MSINPIKGHLYQLFFKRLIDIVGSLILIIIFLPVSIISAICIVCETKGPVFADVPERVGEHGKRFKMLKFRSMIINAHHLLRTDPKLKSLYEECKKGSYKLKNDPRITKVGKVIRKHSIDEIPQILNVLRGEMSLVGPRAYYPDELDDQQQKYQHTKALVSKVLSVKPGITGLWQVSGRSEINFDKRIAIDAQYVDTLSLYKDIQIIFKTPLIMINGRGAV